MGPETLISDPTAGFQDVLPDSERADFVQLWLKVRPGLPLEAEVLSPDVFAGLSLDEIRALPVLLGKQKCRLDDFFEIYGEKSRRLVLHGNLARVKRIGQGMTSGEIVIRGNSGMHLGAEMKGGSIRVYGDTADWLGAEMTGGLIRVHGNAGGQVGAAYRGSRKGMRGGTILVDGSAGIEAGMRMRRGLISIQGNVGDFAGLQMCGGTLFLGGKAGIRTGAWMSRGTIVAMEQPRLLPTFLYSCTCKPVFLRLLWKQFQDLNVPVPEWAWNGLVRRYTGDTSELGKGEILVCDPESNNAGPVIPGAGCSEAGLK